MEIIKTGLAALGMPGQVFHAPFISMNPHLKLCKIVERTRELPKTRYPQTTIVRSFNELTKDLEIDLIVVNTPDNTYYEYTRMVSEAGKNVAVEKPFISTTEQGKESIALSEQEGPMFSVYQNRRWGADFLTVHDILDKSLPGRLVEYESTFVRYRNLIKSNIWRETGVPEGGLTYSLGSHLIDQVVQLLGMPETVFADLGVLRNEGEVDDYFIVHLPRPSLVPDVKITLKASHLMREVEPCFMLHGTLGLYIKYGVDKQEAVLLAGEMPGSPNWGEEPEQEWGLSHIGMNGKEICRKYPGISGNCGGFYQNIYEHLCLGKTSKTHAQDILDAIRIIEAAYQSRRETKIVSLEQLL